MAEREAVLRNGGVSQINPVKKERGCYWTRWGGGGRDAEQSQLSFVLISNLKLRLDLLKFMDLLSEPGSASPPTTHRFG